MKMQFHLKASLVAILASFALPAHAVVFPSTSPIAPGATVYTPMTLDITNKQSVLTGNSLVVGTISVNPANAVVVDRTFGGVTQSIHFVLQGGAVNFITSPYSQTNMGVPISGWLGSTGVLNCVLGGCTGTGSNQFFDAGLMNPLLAFSSNGAASKSTTKSGLFSSNVTQKTWLSIGSLTPVASLPVAGSATYTGVMDGLLGNGNGSGTPKDVVATTILTANFATRSVAFSTGGTLVYNALAPVGTPKLTINANLNLTGTLTYVAGTNTFSGAVATPAAGGLTGTAQGRFYGLTGVNPAEVGGLVSLANATTGVKMAASFGAKTGLPATSVAAGKTVYLPLVANFNVGADPMTGAMTLSTQAVTAATAANSISLYRLPAGLGSVGMDYSFTTQPATATIPATVVAGQVSTQGLSSVAIEASTTGMWNGIMYDGAGINWLPNTGSYWGVVGNSNNLSMQSAAPDKAYNYSDFGMWAVPPSMIPGAGAGLFQAGSGQFISVGTPTVATTIPVTGSATYAGTAVGYYQGAPVAAVAPAVGTTPAPLQLLTANVNAAANFATRTMTFNSTASQLATPGGFDPATGAQLPNTVAAAPTLNMTANLTWVAGANAFSGAVKAQGTGTALAPALNGSLQGRFYGPVAGAVGATKPLEIGGVFRLTSTAGAKMSGAFGAK